MKNTAHTFPLTLRAYLAVTRWLPWVFHQFARRSHRKQGADEARTSERLGIATTKRPNGRLIWVHAASVGELVSLIDLAQRAATNANAALLVTTLTQTSAEIAQSRLPTTAMHQFFPADTGPAMRRFLNHWQPDAALFSENDLWPNAILETKARRVPLALLNVRASRTRQRAPKFAATMLHQFDCVTTQSDRIRAELLALGLAESNIHAPGDLKAALPPLPANSADLSMMTDAFKGRTVWAAASTHDGEEIAIARAHRKAQSGLPGLLLVVLPRHPERGAVIANDLRAQGFSVAVRSKEEPVTEKTEIYLADTLGETGLFYRLSPLVFMGGSFVPKGGHTPYEPALLGAAVLHGPHVENFREAYANLTAAGGASRVADSAELGERLRKLLNSEDIAQMQAAASRFAAGQSSARDKTLALLEPLLGR